MGERAQPLPQCLFLPHLSSAKGAVTEVQGALTCNVLFPACMSVHCKHAKARKGFKLSGTGVAMAASHHVSAGSPTCKR